MLNKVFFNQCFILLTELWYIRKTVLNDVSLGSVYLCFVRQIDVVVEASSPLNYSLYE